MESVSLVEQLVQEPEATVKENSEKVTSSPSYLSAAFLNWSENAACKDGSSPIGQVDSFLIEALSSRNRLTVLRIDQEVERFMRNCKQQQLQFWPMPSSYERLAAHRVAQHYHLHSMVTDCGGAVKGSCVMLVKTPECRIPDIRLVDIPVESPGQEKSARVLPEKVAIKQRQGRVLRDTVNGQNAGDSGNATPKKTVEERSEEYNKARSRIFNISLDAMSEENEASNNVPTSKSVILDRITQLETSGVLSSGDVDEDFVTVRKPNNCRVAIFRDREKDKRDPDYDRSYGRYSQHLNTTSGMTFGLFRGHASHTAFSNINNDFSQSDVSGHSQGQIDQVSHCHQVPWTPSVGLMTFYPDAFLGQFTQAQTSTAHVYFAPPRVSHLDHYNYIEEGFQPGLQYQENFREVKNR